METSLVLNKIKYTSKNYNGLQVACDWIQDLEESNSRLHKEGVIEKALVAARLGSHSAESPQWHSRCHGSVRDRGGVEPLTVRH